MQPRHHLGQVIHPLRDLRVVVRGEEEARTASGALGRLGMPRARVELELEGFEVAPRHFADVCAEVEAHLWWLGLIRLFVEDVELASAQHAPPLALVGAQQARAVDVLGVPAAASSSSAAAGVGGRPVLARRRRRRRRRRRLGAPLVSKLDCGGGAGDAQAAALLRQGAVLVVVSGGAAVVLVARGRLLVLRLLRLLVLLLVRWRGRGRRRRRRPLPLLLLLSRCLRWQQTRRW
mmetsp:Transcript_1074/g.3756  ORF Transcript_1074/g.3756 Transcript_1074/m.3756 type:complete len:234 (-) Transcript_1074:934-1635(-)